MCNDNRRIYDALVNNDEVKAVALWVKKMDDAQADAAKKIEAWRRQN